MYNNHKNTTELNYQYIIKLLKIIIQQKIVLYVKIFFI